MTIVVSGAAMPARRANETANAFIYRWRRQAFFNMLAGLHLVEAPDRAMGPRFARSTHTMHKKTNRMAAGHPDDRSEQRGESVRPMTNNDSAPHRGAPNESVRRVNVVASLLDDAIRVPGTNLRFGVDPLVGLIPGLG